MQTSDNHSYCSNHNSGSTPHGSTPHGSTQPGRSQPGSLRPRYRITRCIRSGITNPFRYRGPVTAVLLLLMVMLPLSDTLAQSGGFSGAFTRIGFGPRGMAMGNAIGTVSQEGIYGHYNPALASYTTSNHVDMATALMSFGRSMHSVNTTFPLPPVAGLNIGLLNANVYDIDGRTSSGYHTEYLSTHEFQLFAAFGINISQRIRLGAGVKLHHAGLYDDIPNTTGAGFDLGVIAEPTASWRLGFAVQDLISGYSWNTTSLYGTRGGRNREDAFPIRYKISTSYFVNTWDLLISTEFEIQQQSAEYQRLQVLSGSVPPQNRSRSEDVTTHSQLFRIGTAWSAHERLTIRGGWEVMDLEFVKETHKISAGFSVHLPYDALSPSVDYAYVREPMGIAGMHVLALRLTL